MQYSLKSTLRWNFIYILFSLSISTDLYRNEVWRALHSKFRRKIVIVRKGKPIRILQQCMNCAYPERKSMREKRTGLLTIFENYGLPLRFELTCLYKANLNWLDLMEKLITKIRYTEFLLVFLALNTSTVNINTHL